MWVTKHILIAVVLLVFTTNLKCNTSPETFFKALNLTSLQLLDSILLSPSVLQQMVNDTNYFRLEKNSNLTKKEYLNKLIDFMKINGFDEYFIKDVYTKGYIAIEGVTYKKLDVVMISKKSNKRINFFLDINKPENQWRINDIYVYQPWENLKYE